MAVRLNDEAFTYARLLIEGGRFVFDERDAWSEDRPTTQDENQFIETLGYEAYGRWHLGINDEMPENTKGHYEFPFGDFDKVHRCGLISAESRAGQYKHDEIERAAAQLLKLVDEQRGR